MKHRVHSFNWDNHSCLSGENVLPKVPACFKLPRLYWFLLEMFCVLCSEAVCFSKIFISKSLLDPLKVCIADL